MPAASTLLVVSPIYVAALALLMVVLSTGVALQRGRTNTALGDGGDRRLALAVRRFGNLSEYAAMAALLLVVMELAGVSKTWLHGYGIALLALRVLHPFALYDQPEVPGWRKAARFVAAAGTVLVMTVGAVLLLTRAL
ncbi:MAG: MAPEG family protein [Pseudomonadota bacterium]